MRSTKESITLPLLRSRGEVRILGWMLLVIGLAVPLIGLLDSMSVAMWVLTGIYSLFLGIPGLAMVLTASMRLHLVPEGAAVSLFGRTLARYPAERLTVIRWDADQLNGPRRNCFVLSTLSMEALAAIRERKLRSSVISRDGVDYQKLRRDWQEAFAIEQLRKMTRLGELFPLRRGVLWLQDHPETAALLKLAYPDARWHDLRRGPEKCYELSTETPRKRADTPQSFRRCHEGAVESVGVYLMLAVSLAPTLMLLLLAMVLAALSDMLTLIGSILSMVWLFGSLGVMGLCFYGSERVSLEEGGIRLRPRAFRERLIPAGELKSAFLIRMQTKGGTLDYLVLSSRTPGELAQMEEARMSKTQWGREDLSALGLLEGWPGLAVRRLLMRRAGLWGYDDPLVLLVAHTDNREQWLRERYPHLRIHDMRD